MPITTLENTKWTFNNTLTFASYAGTYNIIFSNDGKSCTSLELTNDKILYHYNGGTLIAYQDGSWVNENRKTIYITGGTDVANSTLIGFITNCAIQQELPHYGIYDRNNVVKLANAIRAKTGTTALLNHTKMINLVNNLALQKEEVEKTYTLDFSSGNIVDTPTSGQAFSKVTIVKPSTLIPSNILSPVEIAGVQGSIETYATPESLGKVYKFNTAPTIPETAKTYTYNFKSNGTQYTYLAMGNNMITYANSGGEDIVYNNGWTNEEYRTLCFEEVPQGELLTMLNSNAIRQNGELYFTENGETTLATQGKYLDGNLKVIVNVKQLDTSDANATSSDIRYTKSAYVNGVKVEGSIQDYANETANLFSITDNLTNVSAIIPEYIEEGETLMLTITADSGYVLPDSVSVSGASYTWNKDNGELTLSNATNDVSIEIVGVEAEEEPFITFTGESSDFTLTATYKEWDGVVEYSNDKATWTEWDGSAISSSNQKLYLRGSGNTTFYTSKGARFVLSALAGCSGNLNTLLEYINPPTELSASNTYYYMFYNCTNLTTTPELPATTLAEYCYAYMFCGCTNLTTAPQLPATTLASKCYDSMLRNCTSLTTAPELPATTLTISCYNSMFNGCTRLTTAPALPATTLEDYCYHSMFYGCTRLTQAPVLPATTLTISCYNTMFKGCTRLTSAPALPATTLANYCYQYMFQGCTAFKVSSTKTGTYQYAWRIPTSGTISSTTSSWNTNMLANTGGTFTSDPSINTTYYVENEPV